LPLKPTQTQELACSSSEPRHYELARTLTWHRYSQSLTMEYCAQKLRYHVHYDSYCLNDVYCIICIYLQRP